MNSTAPESKSESSFVKLLRGRAGLRGIRWRSGSSARLASVPGDGSEVLQSCEQRIERLGDLLQRGFRFGGGAPVADDFLQHAGGGLHLLGAEVCGHAFERVGEALRERGIAAGQRGGDLRDGRSLLLGELAQEFQIELPVARDAGQAVLRVEAVDGRQVHLPAS